MIFVSEMLHVLTTLLILNVANYLFDEESDSSEAYTLIAIISCSIILSSLIRNHYIY